MSVFVFVAVHVVVAFLVAIAAAFVVNHSEGERAKTS